MPDDPVAVDVAKWVFSHVVTAFTAGWGGHRLGARTHAQRLSDLETAVATEKQRTGEAVERITREMATDRALVQEMHQKNEKRFDRVEDRIIQSAEKTVDRIIEIIQRKQ